MFFPPLFRSRILYSKIEFLMHYEKTFNISSRLFSFNHGHQLIFEDPQCVCYRNKVFCVCKHEISFSTSVMQKNSSNSRLGRLRKKIYDSFSPKAKIRLGALISYEKCADSLEYKEFFSYFNIPDTFQSWFLTLQLHVWMCAIVTISEADGKRFRNELINYMWEDVEMRLSTLKDIPKSSSKTCLSGMEDQFTAALISYDEGLLSHDTVLAAAVWRTVYGFHLVDPQLLEVLVLYIRKQIDHLDSFNAKEDIMFRGIFEFLPLQAIVNHNASEKTA